MDDVDHLFAAGRGYLDAATMGLPPRRTAAALHEAVERWSGGQACAAGYGVHVEQARSRYARLVGVDPRLVAVGSQVSVFAGLVAQGLPDGAEVLVADGEFTSMLFPFLVRARDGVTVRSVPLTALADEVTGSTALVAFSLVQSACGSVADLDAVAEAASRVGARTFVDTTQAVGWLPVDAGRADWTVCAGYKWLCNPRGTAFLTARAERLDDLVPVNAGWYAGEDPWASVYGPGMHLASDARRFDVSPAWLAWVGGAAALDVIAGAGVERIRAHDVRLANELREGLGLPPSNSAIVSIAADGAAERLASAGVRASVRAGRVRLAFHLWNTPDDVDAVLRVLRGLPVPPTTG